MPQDIMRLPALTSTAAYQALEIHAHDARDWQMRQLFQKDPGRFPRMTVDAAGLFLDYSKNRADDETIKLLVHLARTRGVTEQRDAMFAGEKINITERRSVLP